MPASILSIRRLLACSALAWGPLAAATLPFAEIDLRDLSAFRPVDPAWSVPGAVHGDANWSVAGDAIVDCREPRRIEPRPGTGVLLNLPTPAARGHLFTVFEHGDLELEVDVMVPVNSNSGLYFQRRYEIQIFDSWNVKTPRPSDMGGIYERSDETHPPGSRGFEGRVPSRNAARAPGLWQHFRILFRAPRFAADGRKIAPACFEEVWLNGELLHADVNVIATALVQPHSSERSTSRLPLRRGTMASCVPFRGTTRSCEEGS